MNNYKIHDMRESDAAQLPNLPIVVEYRAVAELDNNPVAEQPKWVFKSRESNPIPSMINNDGDNSGPKPRMRKGGRPTYYEVKTYQEMTTREREGIKFLRVGYIEPSEYDRKHIELEVSFNPGEHMNRPIRSTFILEQHAYSHPQESHNDYTNE